MNSETTKFDFPNKTLIKNRDAYQNLSNTNASGNGVIIIGILGAIVFSMSLFVSLTQPKFDTIIIPIFISTIIIICLYFAYSGTKKKIEIDSALYYNPGKKVKKRTINLIVGCIFMGCFLSIFFWVHFFAGASIMFAVVAGIFALLMIVATFLEISKIYYLIKESKKFSSSKLKIISSTSTHLGDQLQIELHNNFISKHLDNVDVMLRNIHECWEIKKGDEDEKHNTYLLYEDVKNLQVSGNVLNMTFNIPYANVSPTDYTKIAPFYWELEISNKDENYFCIFYIEIKN